MKLEEILSARLLDSLPQLETMRVESATVVDSTPIEPVVLSDVIPEELDKATFEENQMKLISAIMTVLLVELEVTIAITTKFLQRNCLTIVLTIKHPLEEKEIVHLDYEDDSSEILHVATAGVLATPPAAIEAPEVYKLPHPEQAWGNIETIHHWVVNTLRQSRQKCLDNNTYQPKSTKAEVTTLNRVLRVISRDEALDLFRLLSRMTFKEIEVLLSKSEYSRRF